MIRTCPSLIKRIPSITSWFKFCSCPTDSLVVVLGGLVAGLVAAIVVLMLCYLCTALRKTRKGEVASLSIV